MLVIQTQQIVGDYVQLKLGCSECGYSFTQEDLQKWNCPNCGAPHLPDTEEEKFDLDKI